MYARILAAIDGGQSSARALKHAIALSKALGAELRALHVVDMGWLPLGPELAVETRRIAEVRREEGARALAVAVDEAQAAGVAAASRLVETGAPGQSVASEIVREAQTWPADLLVLGTHGRGGAERLLLGSVAEGVTRRSTVPVLLVHD
jgi:nucleotide-binding universal stress UspA family protein